MVGRLLRALLSALVLLVSSCATGESAAVPVDQPPELVLGTYKYGACSNCDPLHGPGGNDSYAAWLGSERVRYAQDNIGDDNWEHFENGWPDSFRQWAEWKAKKPGRRLVLAVPFWANSEPGSNSARISMCAAGRFDGHYRALGRNLQRMKLGDSIVRIAWEAHGYWNPWSYRNNPAEWRSCWRRAAQMVKAEAPGLRTNWNVGDDNGGARPDFRYSVNLRGLDSFYPGDDVVDEIGIDNYASPRITDYDAFFGTDVGALGWFVQLAAKHGKPLSFPEWGLWDNRAKNSADGSRDDPAYIEQMHRWMTDPAHRVSWAAYFDINVNNGIVHQLQPNWEDGTVFPQASAKFKELFGSLR